MKRRLLSGLAVLLLVASMALPMAYATETEEVTEATEETTEETTKKYSTATSGTCGKDAAWQLDGHTLYITGTGAIDDGSPWEFYKDTIETLVISDGITAIGDQAFATCNNLRYIQFGSSLKEIGYQAFYSCNALEAIRLPASFRLFGPESFKDCDGLQVVYCEGPMPSFKGSCLYTNHTVQVFYSYTNPWPWEEVERLMTNFGSRLYVDEGSEDVLDIYMVGMPDVTAPEDTQVVEETEPEPTVPETTVPETTAPVETLPQPTVVPTVPETTVPATTEEVVFALESEPLFVTEPEHVPQPISKEIQAQKSFSGITWAIIGVAALTGILILALVIRMIIHSTRRYDD